MPENGPSGSMSGMWKRSTVELLRHRQTKGTVTDRLNPNLTAPHLDSTRLPADTRQLQDSYVVAGFSPRSFSEHCVHRPERNAG
jgi:hypothetical protein